MQRLNQEDFLDKLYLAGIKLNRDTVSDRRFLDLEDLFLESTLHIGSSIRIARYIEYWVFCFGKYLSVKKIKELISKGRPFDQVYLNGLLKIIDVKCERSGPFKEFFNSKIIPKIHKPIVDGYEFKNLDPVWYSVGINAPVFIVNELEKTVRDLAWIKVNCHELYYRIIGLQPTLSDIKCYNEINPKASMYKIAQELNLTYSCVHQNFKKHISPHY